MRLDQEAILPKTQKLLKSQLLPQALGTQDPRLPPKLVILPLQTRPVQQDPISTRRIHTLPAILPAITNNRLLQDYQRHLTLETLQQSWPSARQEEEAVSLELDLKQSHTNRSQAV